MNNPMVYQQNEPLLVSYLPIGRTEGAEEQRGVYRVLCSSPPEMAERAQQCGCVAFKGYFICFLLPFPPVSFDSKNSRNQTAAVGPALFVAGSVSAPALALSDDGSAGVQGHLPPQQCSLQSRDPLNHQAHPCAQGVKVGEPWWPLLQSQRT